MTEEIKKQLEETKSNEEIETIIADDDSKLTDEELEKIAGGLDPWKTQQYAMKKIKYRT